MEWIHIFKSIDLKWFLFNVSMGECQSIDSSNSISIWRWIVTWNSKEFIKVLQSVMKCMARNCEKILYSNLNSSDFITAGSLVVERHQFSFDCSDNAPVLIKFNFCSFKHTFFSLLLSCLRVSYVCFQSKVITSFVVMTCEREKNENHHKTQCENKISKLEWRE